MGVEWGGRGLLRPGDEEEHARFWTLVLVCVALLMGALLFETYEEPIHPTTTSTSCQEDEPCWDCHTMGNRICGPTTTEGANG